MNIIGDKSKFGIEYEIINKKSLMGYSKLWFGNEFIGTEEDLIYFESYLFEGLHRIYNAPNIHIYLYEIFNSFNLKNIYYYFKSNLGNENELLNSYKYLMTMGTFTDNYLVFSFNHKDKIYIIWKIINYDSVFTDINNAKKKINVFSIEKQEFKNKLDEFKNIILG